MKPFKCMAAEQRTLSEALTGLPQRRAYAAVLFARLRRVGILPEDALVLDVGAGTGGFLVACQELGYQCSGIEPWTEARLTAMALSEYIGVPIDISAGIAEEIPYPAEAFNLVHANSVIEHVPDLDVAFAEMFRVLKPGGVLWFHSVSAMCPAQSEIRKFPLFGWYPNKLKLRIMAWAREARPHLIGYTHAPAVNWLTPRKVRELCERHGFRQVYDRWDLRGLDEGGKVYRLTLKAIRFNKGSKAIADVLVPDCSYAAIK